MAVLRKVWGLGVAGVLIVAVAPYPVRGVLGGDGEAMHRIHDTVGAIHYLLWWAVPVLVWTMRRADPPAGVVAAWWMALASAVAMVVTSIPSGDLFSSASWLPLVTLVPLLPARGWWRPRRPDPVLLIAGAVLAAWAWRLAPDLVRAQDVAGGDPHGARFHYGGMAAVYVAAALCTFAAAVGPRHRPTVLLAGAGTVLIGAAGLVWPVYDSALMTAEAWRYVVAGAVIAARGVMLRTAPVLPSTTLALGGAGSERAEEVSWHG